MNAIVGKDGSEPAPMPNTGFRIEPHDRVTIEGMEYRYPGKSGAFVSLQRTDAQGLVDKYEIGNLARLSASGKIRHEVEYYLPDDLKTMAAFKSADFQSPTSTHGRNNASTYAMPRCRRSTKWWPRASAVNGWNFPPCRTASRV